MTKRFASPIGIFKIYNNEFVTSLIFLIIILFVMCLNINRTRTGRVKFSIRNFAAEYNLGAPIAGNLFQAQYDDYVPILREQLLQEP